MKTLLVKGKNGPKRINERDFDAKKHTLHNATKAEKAEGLDQQPLTTEFTVDPTVPIPPAPSAPDFVDPAPATPPSPNTRLVKKDGKKFFVVNPNGEAVDEEGIDKDGYKTEQEAWKAITDLPR